METGEFCRLRLDPDTEKILLTYINERRYQFMIVLYIGIAISLLGLPFAISDLKDLIYAEHGSDASELVSLAGYMLRRYSRYRYSGEIFIIWVLAMISTVINFFTGFGRAFGPGSDHHCVVNQRYEFGNITVGWTKPDCKKHPYILVDLEGNACICLKFLDYRNARRGDRMFCVALDNGRRYVFAEKSDEL